MQVRTEANEPHRVIISRANIDEINEQILPLMMCLQTTQLKVKELRLLCDTVL
jgi:hypothetical protein